MKIALLGDIALIGKYDLVKSNNVYERLKIVHDITSTCDYVIGNLESPLTTKRNTYVCKGAYIKSNPINIELLKYIGVTHVNLANNHIFDYGEKGKSDTIKALQEANIEYVGLNEGLKILEKQNGDKVVLEGFCCLSANPTGYGNKKGEVNLLTPKKCIDFIKVSKKNQCFPIISAHFGIERVHYPSIEHIKFFHDLSKISSYVLHGHHPHIIQGYEDVNNSLLLYSLGNLCFDRLEVTSTKTIPDVIKSDQENYLTILTITGNRIITYEIIPLSSFIDGNIIIDETVRISLGKINDILRNKKDIVSNIRNEEILKSNIKNVKTFDFYVKRLNYKYICSFIKGVINHRLYLNIMKQYI